MRPFVYGLANLKELVEEDGGDPNEPNDIARALERKVDSMISRARDECTNPVTAARLPLVRVVH